MVHLPLVAGDVENALTERFHREPLHPHRAADAPLGHLVRVAKLIEVERYHDQRDMSVDRFLHRLLAALHHKHAHLRMGCKGR